MLRPVDNLLNKMSVFIIFLTFQGCAQLSMTKPLCGPESFDQRPLASLPDIAIGCYEAPNGEISNIGFTLSNIFSAKIYTKSYVFLSKNSAGTIEVFSNQGLPDHIRSKATREGTTESLMWCEVPGKFANQNSRLLILNEEGWYKFNEFKYEPENQILVISSYQPSIAHLKESGLPYVVSPQLSSYSYSKNIYPKEEIFSSNIGMVLIDNSHISPDQLFEKLDYSRSIFHFELRKVDKSFCDQHAKNKIL